MLSAGFKDQYLSHSAGVDLEIGLDWVASQPLLVRAKNEKGGEYFGRSISSVTVLHLVPVLKLHHFGDMAH